MPSKGTGSAFARGFVPMFQTIFEARLRSRLADLDEERFRTQENRTDESLNIRKGELEESGRQFDARLGLDRERLATDAKLRAQSLQDAMTRHAEPSGGQVLVTGSQEDMAAAGRRSRETMHKAEMKARDQDRLLGLAKHEDTHDLNERSLAQTQSWREKVFDSQAEVRQAQTEREQAEARMAQMKADGTLTPEARQAYDLQVRETQARLLGAKQTLMKGAREGLESFIRKPEALAAALTQSDFQLAQAATRADGQPRTPGRYRLADVIPPETRAKLAGQIVRTAGSYVDGKTITTDDLGPVVESLIDELSVEVKGDGTVSMAEPAKPTEGNRRPVSRDPAVISSLQESRGISKSEATKAVEAARSRGVEVNEGTGVKMMTTVEDLEMVAGGRFKNSLSRVAAQHILNAHLEAPYVGPDPLAGVLEQGFGFVVPRMLTRTAGLGVPTSGPARHRLLLDVLWAKAVDIDAPGRTLRGKSIPKTKKEFLTNESAINGVMLTLLADKAWIPGGGFGARPDAEGGSDVSRASPRDELFMNQAVPDRNPLSNPMQPPLAQFFGRMFGGE